MAETSIYELYKGYVNVNNAYNNDLQYLNEYNIKTNKFINSPVIDDILYFNTLSTPKIPLFQVITFSDAKNKYENIEYLSNFLKPENTFFIAYNNYDYLYVLNSNKVLIALYISDTQNSHTFTSFVSNNLDNSNYYSNIDLQYIPPKTKIYEIISNTISSIILNDIIGFTYNSGITSTMNIYAPNAILTYISPNSYINSYLIENINMISNTSFKDFSDNTQGIITYSFTFKTGAALNTLYKAVPGLENATTSEQKNILLKKYLFTNPKLLTTNVVFQLITNSIPGGKISFAIS